MTALTLFQWFALSLLFVVIEIWFIVRSDNRRRFRLIRIFIWLAAAVAIYRPVLLTQLAKILGIQRGADLVLYVAVLFFVGIWLFLYSCYIRQQKQITLLVRRLAIQEAEPPDSGKSAGGQGAQTAEPQ
jgi:hypothetical protein